METCFPATLTSTPLGTAIGCRPIRDMKTPLRSSKARERFEQYPAVSPYHTEHSTSPPIPDRLDSASVIRPFEVEMIAIPIPFLTFGISVAPT